MKYDGLDYSRALGAVWCVVLSVGMAGVPAWGQRQTAEDTKQKEAQK